MFFCALTISKVVFAEGYIYSHKWGSQGSGATQFNGPRKAAIGPDNNIYITDYSNHRIQVFTQAGVAVTRWGTNGVGTTNVRNPLGIAVSTTTGNVFVTEYGNHRVHVFTSTGTHVTMWGTNGSADGQFNRPYGIALDLQGNVWVADQHNDRIQKFQPDGTWLATYGTSGSGEGEFSLPTGVAVDSNGYVYVSEEGNNRIQKFTSDGVFVSQFGESGSGNGQISAVQDIAIDGDDNIYVADYGNVRVQKFASTTYSFMTTAGSYGIGDGQFTSIWGLTVSTSTGNVFVPDNGNHRMMVFYRVGDPLVSIDVASDVTATSTVLNGIIDDVQVNQITTRGFQYGLTTAYGATTTEEGTFDAGAYTASISGLYCESTYHYRAFASHTYDTGYSVDGTFETDSCEPTVVTTDSSTFTSSTFTGTGTIVDSGGSDSTQWGFQYGLTTAYGATTTEIGTKYSGVFYATTTGLASGTTYNFRAYAINNEGVSYGANSTFTTNSPALNASYTLGQADFVSSTRTLTSRSLYGTKGVALDTTNERMFVSDGDNRVLVFDISNGITTNMVASNVIGQPDFETNTPLTNSSTFYDPYGLDYDEENERLFVTDASNNRIMIYDLSSGISNGMAAAYVIGQPDFDTNTVNNTDTGLYFPVGVKFDPTTEYLYVNDYNNYRVMVYDLSLGITNNMPASFVLGQPDFISVIWSTGVNGFGPNPDISVDSDRQLVFVPDQFANRVMVYDVSGGITNGMDASYVIGQPDLITYTANTSVNGLSQPGSVYYDQNTKWLFVGDQLNRRVLVYDLTLGVTDGMNATYIFGQGDFTTSLSDTTQSNLKGVSPIGVKYDNDLRNLYVADYENNRLMVFSLPKLAAHTFDEGVIGSPYSGGATLDNSQGTATWSIVSGSLPTGLSINSSNGIISGTPTVVGTYNFTIEVDSVISIVQTFTDSRAYSITVVAAPPAEDDDEDEVVVVAQSQSGNTSGGRSVQLAGVLVPTLRTQLVSEEMIEIEGEDSIVTDVGIINNQNDIPGRISATDPKSSETNSSPNTNISSESSDLSQQVSRTSIFGVLTASLNNSIPNTIKIVGAIAGIALITVNSVVDVVTGTKLSSFGARISGLLSSAMGMRRRYKPWGTVYDSVTKQPIDPAIVTIYDINGNEVASSITDQDGRYGFLVLPGVYRIKVEKTNYTFPSVKLSGRGLDELYDNLYFGELVTIESPDSTVSVNIPMDNIKFDWNEFEKSKKSSMSFFSKWDLLIHRFFILIFIIGLGVTSLSIFYFPEPYNYITLTVYVLILISRPFGLKPKSFGKVVDTDGSPLSFGLVKIYLPNTDDVIVKKVIDQYGRYTALVSPGKYKMTIEKKKIDGSYTKVYQDESVNAKKGIINSDINL